LLTLLADLLVLAIDPTVVRQERGMSRFLRRAS
jgi:hypothetical protein